MTRDEEKRIDEEIENERLDEIGVSHGLLSEEMADRRNALAEDSGPGVWRHPTMKDRTVIIGDAEHAIPYALRGWRKIGPFVPSQHVVGEVVPDNKELEAQQLRERLARIEGEIAAQRSGPVQEVPAAPAPQPAPEVPPGVAPVDLTPNVPAPAPNQTPPKKSLIDMTHAELVSEIRARGLVGSKRNTKQELLATLQVHDAAAESTEPPSAPESPVASEPSSDGLDDLNEARLQQIAAGKGLAVPTGATKDYLVAAIRAAMASEAIATTPEAAPQVDKVPETAPAASKVPPAGVASATPEGTIPIPVVPAQEPAAEAAPSVPEAMTPIPAAPADGPQPAPEPAQEPAQAPPAEPAPGEPVSDGGSS